MIKWEKRGGRNWRFCMRIFLLTAGISIIFIVLVAVICVMIQKKKRRTISIDKGKRLIEDKCEQEENSYM